MSKETTPPANLRHVRDWVFDLDNTLYPAACDLFSQIDVRMTEFVARALDVDLDTARAVQKKYYLDHGTTLNGLMLHHGLAHEAFLDYVHDIDLSALPHLPDLKTAIDRLPGRKFIFSNGSRGHADRVHKRLGLEGAFDGVFAIEDADLTPKPQRGAFDRFLDRFAVNPGDAAMFEDLTRNLETADALGFTTVLVTSDHDWSAEPEALRPGADDHLADHVHHVTDCLTTFLSTAHLALPDDDETTP